jgi:photosystem II stability/assembly factor-like uncharacterized protein
MQLEEQEKYFKTSNGGAEWNLQNSGLTTSLTSVDFTSEDTGYVVSDNGQISKTIDGGINWLCIKQWNNS